MRDLPPISQLGDHQQTPEHQTCVDRVSDRTMTALNGRLPRTSSLPRHFPGQPAGSPTVPPRPLMQLVSQASVEQPSSPTSRPQSPWCRFDPYDSPEVSSCKSCTQLSVNRSPCNVLLVDFKNIIKLFWISDFPAGPRQRICGFCYPAEPSSQKDGEERVHVYTHGGR